MIDNYITVENKQEILEENLGHTLFSWSKQRGIDPLSIQRAEGIYIYDQDGRRYLDFSSGLVCVNIGHGNQRVTRAVVEQMQQVAYVAPSCITRVRGKLGKKLAEIAPGDLNRTFFTLCGATSMENAIKLARITYTGDYLAQSHFLQTPDPGKMAVGNVDRESIRELYRRSKLPGSIFHQLVLARQSHDCIRQSCWQTCFGGWSVAEQSLLDGTPLDRKSRLCRKGQSDLVSIAGVTIS